MRDSGASVRRKVPGTRARERASSVRLAGCRGSFHALELQLHTGP